jgi:hypothetical protein
MANVYAIEDENNHSMASARMKALLKVVKITNVAAILVHHDSPKSGTSGSGYGRGATATLAAVDSAFHISAKEETEEIDDDIGTGQGIQRTGMLRWKNVKNRRGGRGSLYLEMLGGDMFERRDFAAWKAAGSDQGLPKGQKCREEIGIYLMDMEWHTMVEIALEMEKEGYSENMSKSSVRAMESAGHISKQVVERVSYYRLSDGAPKPRAESAPTTPQKPQRGAGGYSAPRNPTDTRNYPSAPPRNKQPVTQDEIDDVFETYTPNKGTGNNAPF